MISINLKTRITEFKADTEKELTPYSMGKRGKRVTKQFSDHLGIKMSVRLKKIPDEWRPNKEVINYKNTEGWEQYKIATGNAADRIAEIANDRELTIDEVRERISVLDEKLQRECFGTIWIKPNKKSGTKPKPKKEADELFKEHLDDLLKMTDTGADFKDEQKRLWKLKEKVVGTKVGPAEPACINDPMTGELIKRK